MVGNEAEGVDDEHEVVVRVEDLFEGLVKVNPLNPHHNNGSQPLVAAVGVKHALAQFADGGLVQLGDHGMAMVVDDILDPLDNLFLVELGHVGVLEDEFVAYPA